MREKILPKHSLIYIIDKKKKCRFSGQHKLSQIKIKIYNKLNTLIEESLFECSNCKKKFIVRGNMERFIKNYPYYEILYEKQDKLLTKNQIKSLKKIEKKNKEKIKKMEELEKKRKEEILKSNDPIEQRKQKILYLINENKIRVLKEEHDHDSFIVRCRIGNKSIKLNYCENCNLLYCLENEYEDYIKNGISKNKFIYNNVDHVYLTMFNRNSSDKEKKKDGYVKKENKEKNQVTSTINTIEAKTLFVKTANRSCIYHNHLVKDVSVNIDLLNNEGKKVTKIIPAFICNDCNIVYIYDYQYFELIKKGEPLCLIVDQLIYKRLVNGSYYSFPTDSILTIYGYNVNQNENLKQKERQNILKNLIDTNIVRKDVAISHLRGLVKQRKNRKNHQNAIERWESDIEFLTNYNVNYNENYNIDKIIKTKYK